MSAPPFMPLYVADYLSDTTGLTTEQHGAYLLLLMAMWRAGGCLPSDSDKLARFARLTPAKWARIEGEILALFMPCEGGITHKRLAQEIEKASEKSTKRAASGRLGGKASALKKHENPEANAERLLNHSLQTSESDKDSSPNGELSLSAEVIPFAPDPVDDAFALYNEMARRSGLAVAMKMTPARKSALKARLKEVGAEGWAVAVAAIEGNRFFHGSNDRGWRADLDFLLQPRKLVKVIEGGYERGQHDRRDEPTDRARERAVAVFGPMALGAQEALARRRGRGRFG